MLPQKRRNFNIRTHRLHIKMTIKDSTIVKSDPCLKVPHIYQFISKMLKIRCLGRFIALYLQISALNSPCTAKKIEMRSNESKTLAHD